MNILVVEDQDAIRRMIEALVGARGHVVTAASNGAKALEAALSASFDAVLLDVNLPGNIDGIEVCKRLRATEATATVPVVMISAMDDAETRRKATEAGATAYYTKPFSPMALLKEIDGIEERRRLDRQPVRLRREPALRAG
jgi:DNA-binding response OmpR family regulator